MIGHTEDNCVIIRRMVNNARKDTPLDVFLGYLHDHDPSLSDRVAMPDRVLDYLSTLGQPEAHAA